MGPTDKYTALQNPDLIAAPSSDHGSVKNAKWAFSLSHNRLQTGGWARQQNQNSLPVATEMAGVNMRLEPGAVRELHWHKTAEWAYVLKGQTQITAVDQNGRNYVATVGPGDLWYFPAGIPHSLQATDDDPEGSEFVLVFDSGDFSEDSTFLITDWLAHVPAEVLAKNFQTDISAFAHIPDEELFIFPAPLPQPDKDAPKSPEGQVENPYSFAFSKVKATQTPGGSYKVVDSRTFKASKTIAAAEVTLEPGAVRELHWHPTIDEWSFFLEGRARVTIFAAQSNARTFDYQAGDIGYVPAAMGHYVENYGNTTVRFLEIFKSDVFEDISLSNWLALTPPELVKAHLGFDQATIDKLPKSKPVVVGTGNPNAGNGGGDDDDDDDDDDDKSSQ
ncbi:oxalate decarboxylase [Crepidotus variabilis]|uniref:Oxalate decarboxylase n=1 Tax=Crepidotus variabilis TaxID=179855 RepID=A0A9P6EPA9_9AGAR|nr:oxalate decarboxylase [Crepidotus variabilis]